MSHLPPLSSEVFSSTRSGRPYNANSVADSGLLLSAVEFPLIGSSSPKRSSPQSFRAASPLLQSNPFSVLSDSLTNSSSIPVSSIEVVSLESNLNPISKLLAEAVVQAPGQWVDSHVPSLGIVQDRLVCANSGCDKLGLDASNYKVGVELCMSGSDKEGLDLNVNEVNNQIGVGVAGNVSCNPSVCDNVQLKNAAIICSLPSFSSHAAHVSPQTSGHLCLPLFL